MKPDLTIDELLSTTRSVRKRLDLEKPVDMNLIRECLELAIQAPSGSNSQGWHFVVVTDAEKKFALGEIYRKGWAVYSRPQRSRATTREGEAHTTQERVVSSAGYLAEHMHEVPVMVIPCIEGRVDSLSSNASARQAVFYGSILPATWNFMLAARSRGLGTCWTTLHLMNEKAAADVLGIPYETVTQCALIPVAHTKGLDFKPAERKPIDTILHLEGW